MSETDETSIHNSVLRNEIVELVRSAPRGLVVDATIGLGGHSLAILESFPNVNILGIDQDADAVELAKKRLGGFGERVTIVNANFAGIRKVISHHSREVPVAVIADLGVSSLQLDSEERGFSFRYDAPLDMRMDPVNNTKTAADLLSELDEAELARIIYEFGEERNSRKIARWIVEKRKAKTPIRTTFELAHLVKRASPHTKRQDIHPATRTFQALRIAVNDELAIIPHFLDDSVGIMQRGGILAVIAFHSLEDRIVKREFRRMAGQCSCPPRMPECICRARKAAEILTKKPSRPSEVEMETNPRSRSARLRACRKL